MKSKCPENLKKAPPEAIIAEALRKKFSSFKRPAMLALSGPGGAGKSTFAENLAENLGNAAVLALDDYKTSRKERAAKNIYGAHPEANDLALILKHLESLRAGKTVEKPVYCRERGMTGGKKLFPPANFVIAEGETAMFADFKKVTDFSIFIDASFETQLNTRFTRDIAERGYCPRKAGAVFLYSNLIEFVEYGAEGRQRADVLLMCAEDYSLSIERISPEILKYLPDF